MSSGGHYMGKCQCSRNPVRCPQCTIRRNFASVIQYIINTCVQNAKCGGGETDRNPVSNFVANYLARYETDHTPNITNVIKYIITNYIQNARYNGGDTERKCRPSFGTNYLAHYETHVSKSKGTFVCYLS